jgi:outer membrane murein-binding lipoprotein Lpp
MKIAAGITAAAVLAGCATASKDIATSYVSPIQYQSYDCDQLASESQRLSSRVQQLGGRLDEAASNDKAIMAVGAIIFWPALFALGGTKQQEAEYARIKGEAEALQQSAIAKKCPGILPPQPAQPQNTTTAAPAKVSATASDPK